MDKNSNIFNPCSLGRVISTSWVKIIVSTGSVLNLHIYQFTLLCYAFVEVVKKKKIQAKLEHTRHRACLIEEELFLLFSTSVLWGEMGLFFHIVTCPALFNLFQADLFSIGEYTYTTV